MLKAGKPTTAKERAIAAVQEAEPAEKVKTKRFNADLPEELHRQIKTQAAKEGVHLNTLTVRLFTEYLSKISNE